MMRKIAVVTGSRAEYWLLRPLIYKLQHTSSFVLFVTGEHLLGAGLDKIKADNFAITDKVECLSEGDSYFDMAQAISRGVSNFARIFNNYNPEIIVLLGDRYETFAAATAAYSLKIPIAHIHGGEVTHGALDDGFRHMISKMSSLHFVSHSEYKDRLIRMGEDPQKIYDVGAIGLDNVCDFKPNTYGDIFVEYPFLRTDKYFLLTLHSSTLSAEPVEKQASAVINAIEKFSEYKVVVTQSNRDPDGIWLNKKWMEWAKQNKNITFIPILGDEYLNAAYYAQAVIGNSSSGVLEIPYLNRPVINIGTRQDGRIFPKGVFCVDFKEENIISAISLALETYTGSERIYGIPGNISEKICQLLTNTITKDLIYKKFYD